MEEFAAQSLILAALKAMGKKGAQIPFKVNGVEAVMSEVAKALKDLEPEEREKYLSQGLTGERDFSFGPIGRKKVKISLGQKD